MKNNMQICTSCGNPNVPREDMMVKKVSFHEIGKSGRMIRSRTTARLCPRCVVADPAWKQTKYVESPGMREHANLA